MQKLILSCISLYFIACSPASSQPDSNAIDLACRQNADEAVNEAVNKINQQMTSEQVKSLRKKLFDSCRQSFKSVLDPEQTEQDQKDLAGTNGTDTESGGKSEMDTFTRFWLESNNKDKKGIKRMKRLK